MIEEETLQEHTPMPTAKPCHPSVGDLVKINMITYRVRKITKKDILLRPVPSKDQ